MSSLYIYITLSSVPEFFILDMILSIWLSQNSPPRSDSSMRSFPAKPFLPLYTQIDISMKHFSMVHRILPPAIRCQKMSRQTNLNGCGEFHLDVSNFKIWLNIHV